MDIALLRYYHYYQGINSKNININNILHSDINCSAVFLKARSAFRRQNNAVEITEVNDLSWQR